jgi:hypothetical protein
MFMISGFASKLRDRSCRNALRFARGFVTLRATGETLERMRESQMLRCDSLSKRRESVEDSQDAAEA